MKSFPFLFSLLLFFYLTVYISHAEEGSVKSFAIPSDFKSEVEHYRRLAHEPTPITSPAETPFASYENGLNFLRIGDGYSAIQTLKGLLGSTLTPESLKKETHATLGYIYLEQNRAKEALEEFTLLEKEPPLRERARFGIAWSLMEMEEYVKTIAIFEDLVNEFPDGEYTPEALSKTGYCYSRLLSYKNAVESYQKALHVYNKRILAQKNLLLASTQSIPFQQGFIFENPDPGWKLFFNQMKNEPNGYEMMQEAGEFFSLEERLNRSPSLQKESPQYRQSLAQVRTQIQNLFQKFIQEQIREKLHILQDLSTETAVELARNLVLEQSPAGQKSSTP